MIPWLAGSWLFYYHCFPKALVVHIWQSTHNVTTGCDKMVIHHNMKRMWLTELLSPSMMSFGHDNVIKMSTPRKLLCPRTHMFLKDSISSFVKVWCDDLSDSVPLTYTTFNPEVVVNNPRLPAYKIMFVTKLFCGGTTHCVLFSSSKIQ